MLIQLKLVIIILIAFEMCLSVFWANTSYAQVLPTPTQLPPKLHAVKITSPTKGQQAPIGKNLTITGTSLGNATSHCRVSVIGNGIKPYQPATAAGSGGATDYSKWNFVLTPKYTTIKEGPNNKITAKYTCSNNPSAISYYSVNVTGTGTPVAANNSTLVNNATLANNSTLANNATLGNSTGVSNSTSHNVGGSSGDSDTGNSHISS